MPAPVSVIIPTLNSAAVLLRCLRALVEGLEEGLIAELIVSDGGSTDATRQIADTWGATIVSGSASRGGQLRRGCDVAKADWLLILHADTQLAPGWTQAVRAHLATQKAGYFALKFDLGGRLVAAWANLRASAFGLPYGDQGLLLPKKTYLDVGGYRDIPLMEDVAIVRRLRGSLKRLQATAITSSERFRAQGWVRRGSQNLWLLLQYFVGVSPERLARKYNRS